jgi:hypothetical protein
VDLAKHRVQLVPAGARVCAQRVDRPADELVRDPLVPPGLVDGDVGEKPAAARGVVLGCDEADDLVRLAGRRRDDEVEDGRPVATGAPQRVAMRRQVLALLPAREASFVEAVRGMDRVEQRVAGPVA